MVRRLPLYRQTVRNAAGSGTAEKDTSAACLLQPDEALRPGTGAKPKAPQKTQKMMQTAGSTLLPAV